MNKRRILIACAALLTVAIFPRVLCALDADNFYEGDFDAQRGLARSVVAWVDAGTTEDDFTTGAELFDNEWAFGTHAMAVLGLAQVIENHPETHAELAPALERALDRLMRPKTRAFGTVAFGSDGFGHASDGHAYLGYLNLALGRAREVLGRTDYDGEHDRLSGNFSRKLAAAPFGLIETYPGESYPVDCAAVAASLVVHARLTEAAHTRALANFRANMSARYIDADTGMLVQAASRETGELHSQPRGSGTSLAAYFLSVAGDPMADRLYAGLKENAATSFLGFGGIREYPRGTAGGGDIDSGPVLFGVGVSATGFTLAAARAQRDPETFTALFRTATLFGMPYDAGGQRRYAAGGPLGDAILLAMITHDRSAR